MTVQQIIHSEKKIGLIVLQNPNIALSFWDRLLIMKEGKIIHNIEKASFKDYGTLQKAMSDVYEKIKIMDNVGIPVVIGAINEEI